ncbi:MAG: hypothetical protein ACR2O0_12840 [Rhizobiaceae bacterium]
MPPNNSESKLTKDQVDKQLEHILASDAFAKSEQLRKLLTHIVGKTLSGNEDQLLGKNIAADVLGQDQRTVAEGLSTARVEISRLRRRLHQYYDTQGANDLIRIEIPKGAYSANFSSLQSSVEDHSSVQSESIENSDTTYIGILVAVVALMVGFAIIFWIPGQNGTSGTSREQTKREALLSKSPTSLQAVNMAEQARAMIFPIFDVERQKLTEQLFERVVDLDENYSGGHAGLSQILTTLSLLQPEESAANEYREKARPIVARAIELSPADPWTQSAAAWFAVADKRPQDALEYSNRAFELDPDDPHILEFHGAVLLFTGHFDEAAKTTNPKQERFKSNKRLAHHNIYGAAKFHLKDYYETLEAFAEAARRGAPISAPSLVYQAAAMHGLGDNEGAANAVAKIMETWPNSDIDLILQNFYQNPQDTNDIISRLVEVGWK